MATLARPENVYRLGKACAFPVAYLLIVPLKYRFRYQTLIQFSESFQRFAPTASIGVAGTSLQARDSEEDDYCCLCVKFV